MKKTNVETIIYSTVGVVVMLVSVVAINIIAGTIKTRVDLTEEKLYTLSRGTKAILSRLDTPVRIRFYCTQNDTAMPVSLKNYARRVEDLLSEYRQLGKGNIEIEKYDPQPDSDAEDSANLDGIEGRMTPVGDKIYLGLSVNSLDSKVPIPFLLEDREKLLEYDITRAISQVIRPEKPVIGIMSALPVFGEPMNPMMMRMGQMGRQEPWIFVNELKRDFDVRQVQMDVETIEDPIKVLVVVHPKGITDKAQYALDQFLLRGGKLIAFLDPLSVMDSRGSPMNPLQRAANSGSTLDKLLKAWGLEFNQEKVAADLNYTTQIQRAGRIETIPAVLSLNPEAIHTNDIATAQLDSLLLPFAGVFTGTPAAGLQQTVLLKTSPRSQLIDRFMAEFSGEQVVKDFSSSGKDYPLALRLVGKFKTAFPDGKPQETAAEAEPDKEKKPEPPAPDHSLKESAADSVVVLVGDSDLIYDQFCVRTMEILGQRLYTPANGNLVLAQNLTEQLAGDQNLISVRSRATLNRPFTLVKKMQANAEENYRAKIKQLEQDLAETQQRLNELQKTKESGQRFILSPEQQAELANFRKKEGEFKKELKEVRKQLRQDIDSLENRLKWMNIAGMPLVVTLSGITLAFFKRRKTAAK